MNDNIRTALIGFHIFSGNVYDLSFFKRGRQACFEVMKQCDKCTNAFRLLGEDWKLYAELIVALESFAYHLYRYKDTVINKAREKIFNKKFLLGKTSHVSIIFATLPVHIICTSCTRTRSWNCYLLDMVKCPDIMENVWIENSEIVWVDDAFPDDQKQLPRGISRKSCSENMLQIYRRTSMPKSDFNKVACNFIEIALRHGCSPVNWLLSRRYCGNLG